MISERYLRRLKSYCSGDYTKIENYEDAVNDTTQKWECHHRKELTEDGKFAYSKEDLIEKKKYYDRPPSELIFLTESEHKKLHGKGRSDATREKMGKANKGIPKTAEHREKLSKANKGMRYPSKHHDITVSQVDDRKAYQRALYHKKKSLTK